MVLTRSKKSPTTDMPSLEPESVLSKVDNQTLEEEEEEEELEEGEEIPEKKMIKTTTTTTKKPSSCKEKKTLDKKKKTRTSSSSSKTFGKRGSKHGNRTLQIQIVQAPKKKKKKQEKEEEEEDEEEMEDKDSSEEVDDAGTEQTEDSEDHPIDSESNADSNQTGTSTNEEDESEYETSDSSSGESTDPEEEYLEFVPRAVKKDPSGLKKVQRLIQHLVKREPTIEKLLALKMRRKHKAEVFEWIMIYENSMPLSEERKMIRKQIQAMMEMYTKEYNDYKIHKKEIKVFEKKNKDFNELSEIQYSILKLETTMENKEAIYRKYLELMDKTDEINEEFYKLKSWIQCSLKLPFDRIKAFPSFADISSYLVKIREIFDAELFGMDKVKEQLMLFIHGKLVNPDIKGCCLGLVGEPGVGKTSIARCLAKVMDFPFEQITFGGVNSADYIRGFDYTYVGSRPGEIVRCLSRMQYKNGIIFFDEYEKISKNAEISACLLHITDFTQNSQFRDNYLTDLKIDLSSVWFIYSMNSLPDDEALKDRIFTITVEGYSEKERVKILCDYLLPKHVKNLGYQSDNIGLSEEVGLYFIRKLCPEEKGIRTLEKSLKDLLSKICFLHSNQEKIACSFMLPKKYFPLAFPLQVTTEMVDTLMKNTQTTNKKHLSMYC